jgi:hypothetical protein
MAKSAEEKTATAATAAAPAKEKKAKAKKQPAEPKTKAERKPRKKMTGDKFAELIAESKITSEKDVKKCGKKACVQWLQKEGMKKAGFDLTDKQIENLQYVPGDTVPTMIFQIINKK